MNYWTVYIDGAGITDVRAYINSLKAVGYTFFAAIETTETDVYMDYVSSGGFLWKGFHEDSTVIVCYSEKPLTGDIQGDNGGTFPFVLSIEILDENISQDRENLCQD